MHLFFLVTCLLLPVFLSAWDIAVVTDSDIEFLQQGRLVGIASDHLKSLASATYDPIKGDLFVSDNNQPNATIFKINMLSSTGSVGGFLPVVVRQKEIVRSIAFDVVTSTLFWSTGNGHTIHKLSNFTDDGQLKTGEILYKFVDEIPIGLAVDSCRQHLYWTNCNHRNASIERFAIDGTRRELLIKDDLFLPLGITIDQQTKKLYWCDEREVGVLYKIERSDLDGQNREVLVRGTHHEPVAITVTVDKIYWSDWINNVVWSLPKDGFIHAIEPEVIKTFSLKNQPQAIISNMMYHKYQEKDCQPLAALKRQIDENMPKWIVPTVKSVTSIMGLPKLGGNITIEENICLNNGSLLPNGQCDCMKGYSGSRCEVSLCYNYCVSGTCTVDVFGSSPKCKCPLGKMGDRCETDTCLNACLNDGFCIVTAGNQVSCKCEKGYSGKRCETKTAVLNELCRGYCQNYEITIELTNDQDESLASSTLSDHSSIESYVSKTVTTKSPPLHLCNCSQYSKEDIFVGGHGEQLKKIVERNKISHNASPEEFVSSSSPNEGRANIIVTASLSITCVILLLAVILLSTRVFKLKRRPRIRKRIVVNRPPLLDCRQQSPPAEQCEITIENCCNMNICETPCFESEFQSSKATFNKSKSDDKKALLANSVSSSREEMF